MKPLVVRLLEGYDFRIMMIFGRTLYLLSSERARGNVIALTLVGLLLAVWSSWLGTGRLTVQTVARSARFEAEDPPLPVQPDVEGRVTMSNLRLGKAVQKGDVLLTLDTTRLSVQREGILTRIAGLEGRSFGLAAELQANEGALEAQRRSVGSLAIASLEHVKVARIAEANHERDWARAHALELKGLGSREEAERAAGQRDLVRQEAATAGRDSVRDVLNAKMSLYDRLTQIAALEENRASLKADVDNAKSELRVLDAEIERYQVKATIGGRLADLVPVAAGQHLAAGTRIATIVPETNLHVVAQFAPEEAVGRVEAGQHVVLRVDNYSWVQYGTVDAVVEGVASETRDGAVRAELRITRANPQIPLTHGLTAQAEVDVERITPFMLLLRMAGQATPRTAPSPGGPAAVPASVP